MEPVHSDFVVISWWSNCLGLTCLHHLVKHTRHRDIYLVQVGKTDRQKEHFREHMPASVKELTYSAEAAAEHGRVIETIAYQLLPNHVGLWFVDHDAFIKEDAENWFSLMDRMFSHSNLCLGYPQAANGLAITYPAFWLSPRCLPPAMPSFTYTPYLETRVAKQPYTCRYQGDLIAPEKDTMVLAKEFLAQRGLACGFPISAEARWSMPLAAFPRYIHLSGVYMLAGPILSGQLYEWMNKRVQQFTRFYETCPHAWLEIEDPVLLQRLREFQAAVGVV